MTSKWDWPNTSGCGKLGTLPSSDSPVSLATRRNRSTSRDTMTLMGDMDLLHARAQMGLSLAFHIVFAVIGMAMPVMMVAAEVAWIRTRRPEYLDLAKRWARGTAILFAVGAVSGTVLSFE